MVRGKEIETFFENRSSNRWLLSLYGVKEETIFIFNLTIRSFRSLYGAKKIFHSIFGRNGSVWGVRAWKEKQSFFIINLANRYLLSLYGAWKEVKIFLFQLSKWTFAVQIVVKKGKSFGFWLRFPSFPTRYIGKMIFFFQSFFDNWIKQFNTFDRQRAVETDTPWPFPCKSER